MTLRVCSSCSTRFAPGLECCPHCGSPEHVEEGSTMGSRLPFLDVSCPTEACPHGGKVRRVHLRQAVLGVVEMPHLLLCAGCGSAMPIVAARIGPVPVPIEGLEGNMPKITRHGGPSNAGAEREQEGDARPLTSEPSEGIEVPADATESPEITGDGIGEAPPAGDEEEPSPAPKKPARRGSRKAKAAPDGAAAELTITAEAEVTREEAS